MTTPIDFYYDTTSSRLRDAALAPSTHLSYTRNLDKFLTHTRLSLSELMLLSPTIIDQRMAEYIDDLFARRGSYEYACQAVFGLIYRHPPIKLHLGESRMRLRGWKRLKNGKSHPPITWELTCVFAATMAKWGRHAEAVATLVAFDCFLRVGEMTRIQYDDVAMPNDPRMGGAHAQMVLRLARTKTGLNQSVSIDNPVVRHALHGYLLAYPFVSRDRIFPFSPSAFRRTIREVSTSLGLSCIPFVPHSFRHGGATHYFFRGMSIEDIMFRGRWVALESTRRYITTARALLLLNTIPSHLHDAGRALAPYMADVLITLIETVPTIRIRRW
jgi:integrase